MALLSAKFPIPFTPNIFATFDIFLSLSVIVISLKNSRVIITYYHHKLKQTIRKEVVLSTDKTLYTTALL